MLNNPVGWFDPYAENVDRRVWLHYFSGRYRR
ncbi:Uncharacterised protein [Vibrio cholerae]|nr:Uncharacterised protein [Vibrio cholerae]